MKRAMQRQIRALHHAVTVCAVVSLLSAVAASEAQSGQPPAEQTIRVAFDFLASELDLLGSTIVVPPDGSVDSASAVIDFLGDGMGGIALGPASLHSFEFQVTVDADVLQNVVSGSIDAQQVTDAQGVLSQTGQVDFSGTMTADAQVDLVCSGPFCSEIADFPILFDDEVVFTDLGSLTLTDLAAGPAQAAGVFDIEVGGLQGVITLSGSEVSRVVLPEPAGGAGVALLLVGLLRRRRTRRGR